MSVLEKMRTYTLTRRNPIALIEIDARCLYDLVHSLCDSSRIPSRVVRSLLAGNSWLVCRGGFKLVLVLELIAVQYLRLGYKLRDHNRIVPDGPHDIGGYYSGCGEPRGGGEPIRR